MQNNVIVIHYDDRPTSRDFWLLTNPAEHLDTEALHQLASELRKVLPANLPRSMAWRLRVVVSTSQSKPGIVVRLSLTKPGNWPWTQRHLLTTIRRYFGWDFMETGEFRMDHMNFEPQPHAA